MRSLQGNPAYARLATYVSVVGAFHEVGHIATSFQMGCGQVGLGQRTECQRCRIRAEETAIVNRCFNRGFPQPA
jgi:hypothetical protein